MPLTVEISSLPIIRNNFYFQQLIDSYPGRTFMLMNDACPDLSFKTTDNYISNEIKKLGLKLFAPNSDTDSISPDNLHITYDASSLHKNGTPEDILIKSDEQKIKFVDPGIVGKFRDNYPACSVFKAISTPRPDNKFNEIKGAYHVKTIDYRIYKDMPNKYQLAHSMNPGTIRFYMFILYDFICNSEANTLFLIQAPSLKNGSYAINYFKIIFFIIYEQLKFKIDSGYLKDINVEKKIIFKLYGFQSMPQILDLIHFPKEWYNEEDARHFNELLKTTDIRAKVEIEISMLMNGIRKDLLGVRNPPLQRSPRASSDESSDDDDTVDNDTGDDETYDNEPDDNESVDNESTGNESVDNESTGNNSLDNESTGNESVDNENSEPTESGEENLLDDFYQHMEDWVGDVIMDLLFKKESPEIVELETFVPKILGKNPLLDKMTNKEKLKKIFDKFRNGEIKTDEETPISGGSLRTLEDFKNYIKQKIKEIIPKNVQ